MTERWSSWLRRQVDRVQQNDHRLLWAWRLLPAKPDAISRHNHVEIPRIVG
jgi:hypothetical protein